MKAEEEKAAKAKAERAAIKVQALQRGRADRAKVRAVAKAKAP